MTNKNKTTLLLAHYRRLRLCTLFMLLLLISALGCVFYSRTAALAVLGCTLLYHFLFLRRQQALYSDAITQANLLSSVCPALKTTEIHRNDGFLISLSTIRHAAFMPVKEGKGSPLLCWGMAGSIDGLSVSLCDATIAQDFELKENGRKRIHYNCGAWIHVELPQDTGKQWCLLDEVSVPTPIRMAYFSQKTHWSTAPIGSDAVSKRCVLYQPADAVSPLSEKLLRELQTLIDYTPGYLAVSVNKSSVDFFVRGRFLARPVSLSKPPTQESLAFDPFPELPYLLQIAKAI